MTKFSQLPFTERLISAHPSLEYRDISEVVATSLMRFSPARRRERTRETESQRALDIVLGERLGALANTTSTNVVQIGAHDGQSDDPLHRFLNERHWSAVLVEPTRLAFQALQHLRASRPETTLINKAVTPDGAPVQLFVPVIDHHEVFGTVWTSTDRKQVAREVQRNLGKHMLKRTHIEAVTLESISPAGLMDTISREPTDIDVLVCDIEGQDPALIDAFLDMGVHPEVLLFEHYHAEHHATTKLKDRLVDEGYTLFLSDKDTLAVVIE